MFTKDDLQKMLPDNEEIIDIKISKNILKVKEIKNDIKLLDHCKWCGIKLPKKHNHHFLCTPCWKRKHGYYVKSIRISKNDEGNE